MALSRCAVITSYCKIHSTLCFGSNKAHYLPGPTFPWHEISLDLNAWGGYRKGMEAMEGSLRGVATSKAS